jgi:hypothetical protein
MADDFSPSFRATSFPSGNQSPPKVHPPQDYRVDLSQGASNPPVLGRPIESPRPSDKERLVRLCQVGLFDIWGLATAKISWWQPWRPGSDGPIHPRMRISVLLKHDVPRERSSKFW